MTEIQPFFFSETLLRALASSLIVAVCIQRSRASSWRAQLALDYFCIKEELVRDLAVPSKSFMKPCWLQPVSVFLLWSHNTTFRLVLQNPWIFFYHMCLHVFCPFCPLQYLCALLCACLSTYISSTAGCHLSVGHQILTGDNLAIYSATMSQSQQRPDLKIGKSAATEICSQVQSKFEDCQLQASAREKSENLCDYDNVSSDSDSDKENLVISGVPNSQCRCTSCARKAGSKPEENKPPGEKWKGIPSLDRKRPALSTRSNSEMEEPFPGFRSAKELCSRLPGK